MLVPGEKLEDRSWFGENSLARALSFYYATNFLTLYFINDTKNFWVLILDDWFFYWANSKA